jgi:UDP-N-acetylmuramoyl-L-alanyl-D-glutamate--2,6-diaminopimelate ligase
VDGAEFDIAAVTIVGSDHLDFHGSRGAYVAAKGRLIEMLDESVDKGREKTAVLNIDDGEFERFKALTKQRVLSYGIGGAADVRALNVQPGAWGSTFTIEAGASSGEVALKHPGMFSVQNAVAASAIGLAAGLDLARVIPALQTWPGAPGRMELIDEGQHFRVVVDFAHAPDSLERVLDVLREHSSGRLIVAFGCIGERERDRRRGMGRVAAERADFTIVTDDNPYTEDRDAIIAEIVAGLESSGKRQGHDFAVIPDRREAIAHALAMAVDDDTVLLAGKGHETQVHLPGSVYECDDRKVARSVIQGLVGTTNS